VVKLPGDGILIEFISRPSRSTKSSLILEMRRTCAHKLAERAGEMARILKADSESHLQDVMLTILEFPLGAFNSLKQDVFVRSVARAQFEQLRKVVRAHTSYRSKLRQADIFREIISNVIKHAL